MNHIQYPPFGLHLPVDASRTKVIDGDTVVVSLTDSPREWKLRLIDTWCAELPTEEGKRAKKGAEEFVAAATEQSVFIPAPKHVKNLLSNLTFDRIPAYLFIAPDLTLNAAMVIAGYATEKKPKKK